jgi:hypothetical protein
MNINERSIIIIIGIQPLGLSGQRPELSQATGMALVRCIMGKFLGVVCHCFPPKRSIYCYNWLTGSRRGFRIFPWCYLHLFVFTSVSLVSLCIYLCKSVKETTLYLVREHAVLILRSCDRAS